MSDPLLTTRQVAEMLNVCPETVLRWWRLDRLPGFRLPSGALRFSEREIEGCKEQWRGGCEPPSVSGVVFSRSQAGKLVSMVDTVPPKTLLELERNRKRREAAEETLHVERERLTALLHRGKREGASIAALARAAGVSRETAHKLLRRPDPAQEDMRGRNRAS